MQMRRRSRWLSRQPFCRMNGFDEAEVPLLLLPAAHTGVTGGLIQV